MAELSPIGDRFKDIGVDIRAHAYSNTITAASYTSTLFDDRALQLFNSASAQTWTIPPDGSIPFDDTTVLTGIQIGAGTVTLAAGAGVTLTQGFGVTSLASKGQYALFQLVKLGPNQWLVIGSIG